jgi:hypothetical protein
MKLAGLLLAGSALVLPKLAEADCGNRNWIGTPAGSKIPAKGSLFVYDEYSKYPGELSPAKGAIKQRTKVGDSVIRLDYESTANELEIKLTEWDAGSVFNIDPRWRAPQALPRVIQYWHHASSWTCSHADSLMLQIDQPTAAFRAVWKADGKAARTWIIPAQTGDDNRNVLELGKIDCGSTTIEPEELAAGGALTLFAIRYDGTEVVVTGLPPRISTKDLMTSEAGVSQAIGYFENQEPVKPAPRPAFEMEEHHQDVAWQVFLCVMGVLVPLLYVRFANRTLKPVV